MSKAWVFVLCLCGFALGDSKPPGVRTSTWVREDLFAGFMVNDMSRFDQGLGKLEAVLAAEPDAPDAIAWRVAARLFLAVRAYEATGKLEEFESLYARARQDYDRAGELALNPGQKEAVAAIASGSYTLFSDRLPEPYRQDGWAKARENLLALRELQKDFFDRLPLHMRGEVLAGLAQAAQRLGESAEASSRLRELIDALPDSPYAARARRWREKPEIAARTSLTCQTRHEPGRLQAVLQQIHEQKKQ